MKKVTFDNSKGYGVHGKEYVTVVITPHSWIDEQENVQISVHGEVLCKLLPDEVTVNCDFVPGKYAQQKLAVHYSLRNSKDGRVTMYCEYSRRQTESSNYLMSNTFNHEFSIAEVDETLFAGKQRLGVYQLTEQDFSKESTFGSVYLTYSFKRWLLKMVELSADYAQQRIATFEKIIFKHNQQLITSFENKMACAVKLESKLNVLTKHFREDVHVIGGLIYSWLRAEGATHPMIEKVIRLQFTEADKELERLLKTLESVHSDEGELLSITESKQRFKDMYHQLEIEKDYDAYQTSVDEYIPIELSYNFASKLLCGIDLYNCYL
ncbi:hypothetical protein ACI3E1_07040 [Ligilactobacillus sp. LYQ139]|uniref:hypothetical protein n=1 Tax=Ligilactobacillus sp. LYQ139 TaxID=3378800 RepID=UPI0038555C94